MSGSKAPFGRLKARTPVTVTSLEDHVIDAPGVVTGYRKTGHLRVRVRIADTDVTLLVSPEKVREREVEEVDPRQGKLALLGDPRR